MHYFLLPGWYLSQSGSQVGCSCQYHPDLSGVYVCVRVCACACVCLYVCVPVRVCWGEDRERSAPSHLPTPFALTLVISVEAKGITRVSLVHLDT